jgi:hypothetical protein
MQTLTRNGVAKDLKVSPYCFTEVTEDGVVTFNFSSKLHLNNFIKKREENYTMIYNYIYKRFKFKINCRMLADCNLYQKIENRGFYILINNKEFLCPSSIILNGESKTKKNLEEWQETLMLSLED